MTGVSGAAEVRQIFFSFALVPLAPVIFYKLSFFMITTTQELHLYQLNLQVLHILQDILF